MRLAFNLAPPLISRIDQATGRPQKIRFGGWMLNVFKLLAKGKRLRHTRFDPFGYTAERRLERQLIEDYQRLIERLVAELTPDNADALIEIAALPMSVRLRLIPWCAPGHAGARRPHYESGPTLTHLLPLG